MVSLEEAHKHGLVVGLKDVNGVKERLDIDILLLKHPDTFNLLVMALKEIKGEEVPWKIDPDFMVRKEDKMSYYQMAGIHGLPSAPWDGERGRKPEKAGDPGYCVHGTPAFGSWHRPYLAMLEQSLYRQAENIVERFNRSTTVSDADKQAYRAALENFRLPYWDYFRPRGGARKFAGVFANKQTVSEYDYSVPLIFTTKDIMVKTLPDNELKPMPNPFFNYKFATSDLKNDEWGSVPSFRATAEERLRTVRWGGDEESNIKALNDGLNVVREDQMRVILVMLEDERSGTGSYTNFLNFATNGIGLIKDLKEKGLFKGPLFSPTGSIEGIHDNYHCYLGGSKVDPASDPKDPDLIKIGHMMAVPIAAFDPVFWFHHCNIDRYFAIWQAVNPDNWFDDIPEDHRLPDKARNPGKGPLSHWRELDKVDQLPFRRAPNASSKDANDRWQFWTCDSARSTDVFGYRYPDTDPFEYRNANQVRQAFADRYSWARRMEPWQKIGDPPAEMQPLKLLGEGGAQCYQYKSAPPSFDAIAPLELSTEVASTMVKTFSQTARDKFLARPKPKVAYEWFIDTVVERMALDGAFTMFFFVGQVTGTSAPEWMSLPSYVGVVHIFAAPRSACDNCGQQAEQSDRVTNTISMTSLLLDYVETGSLASMEPEDVKPFLVENLRWKIRKAGDATEHTGAEMSENHAFRVGVSLKTSPLRREAGDEPMFTGFGDVEVERDFLDVIDQIIDNARPSA